MNEIKCLGCGVILPEYDGPTHRYMESSSGCWAMYGEILAREYSNPDLMEVHRLSVDTYAVQHPGRSSRASIQSVGIHLIRLCLLIEHGLVMEHANDAMLEISKRKHSFIWLEPPPSVGNITVKDVWLTKSEIEHKKMVKEWAKSTWLAWSIHHKIVNKWLVAT